MDLDMVNSYASFATVRVMVLFYSIATLDTCSSCARTSAIHKVRDIQCSAERRRAQRTLQLRESLKTFTGLAEIPNSKCLREKPEVMIAPSCSFILLRYTRLFPFCRNLLEMHRKYQMKWPIYNPFLSFCRNYTFKCLFLEKKKIDFSSESCCKVGYN